jgi:hypothetical protein
MGTTGCGVGAREDTAGSTTGLPRTVLRFTTRFSLRIANGDIAGSASVSPTSENCSILFFSDVFLFFYFFWVFFFHFFGGFL